MRKISKILFLTFICLLSACGGGGGSGSDDVGACSNLKIVNGDVCESKKNPVVKLIMTAPNGVKYECSGTIITRTSVLTAAHCVVGYKEIEVRHRNARENIEKGYYCGGFTGSVGPNDIAILKVSTAFTNAANFKSFPLNISKEAPIGSKLVTYGFGRNENGVSSEYFPKAAYVTLAGYDGTMLLTKANTGYADHGDSGGPLVYEDKIAGVLSGGWDNTGVSVYANVRNTLNYQFIMSLASDVARKSNTNGEDYSDIAVEVTFNH